MIIENLKNSPGGKSLIFDFDTRLKVKSRLKNPIC